VPDPDPIDLVYLADEENSVIVRVLGRMTPGILTLHDYLRAEISVASGFANGQLDCPLAPRDIDGWERLLDQLDDGQSVQWMDDGRNPEIQIERTDDSSYVDVVVLDHAQSVTSIRVAVNLAGDWIADHRDRLRRVRETWPSEVVQTEYGLYGGAEAPSDLTPE
jgi:hypothetical protein